MELFAKIIDCIQPSTILAKHFILGISHGYEYASDKTKQNPGTLSQEIRKNLRKFFHFYIPLYLYIITFRCDLINHKFNTRVFNLKLIHPCNWILMILISHYLPVQTHRNNYRPTFSNFFAKSKKIQGKLHIIVLTLW